MEYLGSVELHMGVVLDLPEPLVEALPLVGPGIPVLVGQVGEDIFGPQECSGRTEEADSQLVKVTNQQLGMYGPQLGCALLDERVLFVLV